MSKQQFSPVNPQKLLSAVRAELTRQNSSGNTRSARTKVLAPPGPHQNSDQKRPSAITSDFPIKDSYDIAEFLQFHGANFISIAYRGILRRSPDPTGAQNYMARLADGS